MEEPYYYSPITKRCFVHSIFALSLTRFAFRNPNGITYGYATFDLLLQNSPITKQKGIGEFIVTLMNSPITKRCFVIAFSPFGQRTSFPSKREESHKARREFFKQTLSFFVCNKRLHYQSTTSCTTIPLPSRSSPHQSWGGHPLRSPRSVLPQQHPTPPLLHRTRCIRHQGREYHPPWCKPPSARE